MNGSISSRIAQLIQPINERLAENKPVRRKLPVWGRIHMDRQLPFLCIYRHPVEEEDKGTEKFAQGEASHMLCTADPSLQPELSRLTRVITENLIQQFGACLILEVWSRPMEVIGGKIAESELKPAFTLIAPKTKGTPITSNFQSALGRIRIYGNTAQVAVKESSHYCPKDLPPLISSAAAARMGGHVLGIEISTIYRDSSTGEVFPDILRKLDRQFTKAIQLALFNYTNTFTLHRPPHYHALGRLALVKAFWEVDRSLAEVSDSLELLLNVTPVNSRSSWDQFRRSGYDRIPQFHYRPLPVDPFVLKQQLYKVPVDRLEDPAMSQLFREKMEELDQQISMLQARDTEHFLHAGFQVYGGVEEDLDLTAKQILETISPRCRTGTGRPIIGREFAELAHHEIGRYRKRAPDLKAAVELRDDTVGLLASRGKLLVSSRLKVPESRVNALIQHEVGTHLLTYHNGRSQRFQQLYSGLAGYEPTQEGLAVLNEYLVGGLNRARLSLLAARVIAVQGMLDGADFLENYREMTGRFGFARRSAFGVLVRVYRGGGLTKDAAYLRGFQKVFHYVQNGGNIDELYIGKIALEHLPIIRELKWRKVLSDPPLLPYLLSDPGAQERLKEIQNGLTFMQLVHRSKT
jgi:uncharacterized protein (TIGR02421 family)